MPALDVDAGKVCNSFGNGSPKLSLSSIPGPVRFLLWGKTGGRCEYRGCNKALYRDSLTTGEFNRAYIAHIIADKPGGPRGDTVLSPQLAQDISNLMILCDEHHRLIDIDDVPRHTVDMLRGMKKEHEDRMEMLQSLADDLRSHVLLYGSRIGEHHVTLNFNSAKMAMLPKRYPADHRPIELGISNGTFTDDDPEFWRYEVAQLQKQFRQRVEPLLATSEVKHLSIFALAAIPLLMELGRLLSDIPTAEVYECQREPAGWAWDANSPPVKFILTPPDISKHEQVDAALVLSLSGKITHDRIFSATNPDIAIWEISHPDPKPGFLRNPASLSNFRDIVRTAYDRIKVTHGYEVALHVFPAMPAAAAVESGRVWLKKADPSLLIYDQSRATGGFRHVHTISQPAQEA